MSDGDRTVKARPVAAYLPTEGPTVDSEPATQPLSNHLELLPIRYVDRGVLGAGGMGEVRRVLDQVLERTLAMKIVRSRFAANPSVRGRFLREARITAGLQHPGIVAVHDQGELADGRLWYTMQEVRGKTLAALLGEMPLRRRIEVLLRAAQAMGYAHRQGVIHRDIKPSNLMVGAFGEVLVLDWGLARQTSGLVEEFDGVGPSVSASHDSTRMGTVMGTRAYMSPEQAAGMPVGPTTDVFAFGVMLRDVLSAGEGAPDELWAICRQAMAQEPKDRFPDAVPFSEALLAWLDGARRRAEAQQILEQARGLLRPLAQARKEAEALAHRAEVLLAPLPPHAPVEVKLPGWRLQRAARDRSRAVRLLELELVQKARSALERAEDFADAHDLLADLFYHRAVEAEARRDEDALAEYMALLRVHDRGQHADWLAGEGRFTLQTEPQGATVKLFQIVEEDRRLVPRSPTLLGTSPIVGRPLPPGSYEAHIEAPGRALVILPVLVERCADWTAGPPQQPHRPIWLPPALEPDEVYVPAGWFLSGGDSQAADPLPRRRVWLDGFVIQRFPVTQEAYLAFLNDRVRQGENAQALEHAPRQEAGVTDAPHLLYPMNPAGFFEGPPESVLQPVVGVDWYGACAYATWLEEQTGQPWRLPHELEWEKSARGVDGRNYPWGDAFEPTWARALHSTPGPPYRVSVHDFPQDASALGVRGLAGNVRQWCLNTFMVSPPEEGSIIDPSRSAVGESPFRSVRGGSMVSGPDLCRSAARFGALPDHRRSALGFRLVRQAVRSTATE